MTMRTLNTTTMEQAAATGAEFSGKPGAWVCIGKAWHEKERWMKSTKVMEIPGVGCLVQVSTREGVYVAEALEFIPGVELNMDRTGMVKI